MKIRFLHNSVTGIGSHRLYLDMVEFDKVTTDDQTGAVLADIYTLLQDVDVEVDEIHTDMNVIEPLISTNLDAPVSGAVAPTVEEIRQEIDANSTQLAALVDIGTWTRNHVGVLGRFTLADDCLSPQGWADTDTFVVTWSGTHATGENITLKAYKFGEYTTYSEADDKFWGDTTQQVTIGNLDDTGTFTLEAFGTITEDYSVLAVIFGVGSPPDFTEGELVITRNGVEVFRASYDPTLGIRTVALAHGALALGFGTYPDAKPTRLYTTTLPTEATVVNITYNGDETTNVITWSNGSTWTHIYSAGLLTSITVA
jgi:hypothetical protein